MNAVNRPIGLLGEDVLTGLGGGVAVVVERRLRKQIINVLEYLVDVGEHLSLVSDGRQPAEGTSQVGGWSRRVDGGHAKCQRPILGLDGQGQEDLLTLRTASEQLVVATGAYEQLHRRRRHSESPPSEQIQASFSLPVKAGAVIPCGWEGNRRSGVALAKSHELHRLRAHGLRKDEADDWWAHRVHSSRGMAHYLYLT